MDRSWSPNITRYCLVLFGVALVTIVLPAPLIAATWNIEVDGSGDAPTIQAGIDSAAVGDTVLVWPGTYYENVDFLGKDIVLLAKYGPAVTTIDGSQVADSVIKLVNGEGPGAIVEGFTITGGRGMVFDGTRGGGIMSYRSSPVIRANRIVRNTAEVGAGVGIGDGLINHPRPSLLVEGNLFAENAAEVNGGALSIEHVDIIVRKNVFERNSCGYDGGAIKASFAEGSEVFAQNQFLDNEAGDHGGGLYVAGLRANPPTVAIVESNIFARNSADGADFGDTGSGGGAWLSNVSGSFVQNTLVANIGLGEAFSSGGGLLVLDIPASLRVDGNIFAYNEGSGVGCRVEALGEFGTNLFWQNTVGDVGGAGSNCPSWWEANKILADPLFCGPATDDFRVASNSPALTGEEVMGAYPIPGCGPGVPVLKTTWGQLKARY